MQVTCTGLQLCTLVYTCFCAKHVVHDCFLQLAVDLSELLVCIQRFAPLSYSIEAGKIVHSMVESQLETYPPEQKVVQKNLPTWSKVPLLVSRSF